MALSSRVESVPISGTLYISEIVRAMEKKGKKILRLDIGDLNFRTPDHIVRALEEAINKGMTHYASSKGIRELREAIAQVYERRYGVDINSKRNVIITPGAKFALYAVLYTVLNKGEKVLIPTPCWVSYEGIVRMCEGIPVLIKTEGEEYCITYDLLTKHYDEEVKAIIINTPNNPTGKIYTLKELREVKEFANERRIFVISDEVYDSIVFDGEHISMLDLMGLDEGCIIVNSFSKKYAMTGWRLGYIIANEDVIRSVNKVIQQSISCVPPFVQWAGYVALTSEESQEFIKRMIKELKIRRDVLDKGLRGIMNVTYRRPEATFYFFVRIPYKGSSVEFSKRLLEEHSIAVVPGKFFGGYDNYIRLSFGSITVDELRIFIDKFKEAVRHLSS